MQDQFPIVWKVLRLQKDIPTHTTVTYTTKFAFSTPQLENGNIVTPETWREVSVSTTPVLVHPIPSNDLPITLARSKCDVGDGE
ncbi:hypothetical protein FRC02_002434 [Tulasnella sp. 418]|nr:hypothetical protein FRC02_002434 [Tulasnella sp. 418]